MIMTGKACWLTAILCFTVACADDFRPGYNARTGEGGIHGLTCQQVCARLNIKDGCRRPREPFREEVVVITNDSSTIQSWKWDTITMVVTNYYDSISNTGLTACVTHSKGKRYGVREPVPEVSDIKEDKDVKQKFLKMVSDHQTLLMADHVVFDLLTFFHQLENLSDDDKSTALTGMGDILMAAASKVRENYESEVYCVVPWEPPCQDDCAVVRHLLGNCHILLLSPDSYMPKPSDGVCTAQATVPISKFLYGVDRYIALNAHPIAQSSIVAGIPWHGYTYKCDDLQDDTCTMQRSAGQPCFDSSNRFRHSLSEIHSMNIAGINVKLDEVGKGIYYNLQDKSRQMWYENFTTLLIKYQLVQDLNLRGLSIWYGEDLAQDMSTDGALLISKSWNFLTHHVLHKAVYNPVKRTHVYADTVAGVGVGCLLLGTALGVLFTCIAFRRQHFRRTNRPFKLDEVDDGFRDDEGL